MLILAWEFLVSCLHKYCRCSTKVVFFLVIYTTRVHSITGEKNGQWKLLKEAKCLLCESVLLCALVFLHSSFSGTILITHRTYLQCVSGVGDHIRMELWKHFFFSFSIFYVCLYLPIIYKERQWYWVNKLLTRLVKRQTIH